MDRKPKKTFTAPELDEFELTSYLQTRQGQLNLVNTLKTNIAEEIIGEKLPGYVSGGKNLVFHCRYDKLGFVKEVSSNPYYGDNPIVNKGLQELENMLGEEDKTFLSRLKSERISPYMQKIVNMYYTKLVKAGGEFKGLRGLSQTLGILESVALNLLTMLYHNLLNQALQLETGDTSARLISRQYSKKTGLPEKITLGDNMAKPPTIILENL